MALAFYICEKKAKVRQIKRIEKTWAEHQQIEVDKGAVKTLLDEERTA